MKRWTLRAILCLILGAITTVAVAWGCARWSVSIEELHSLDWPYPPTEVPSSECTVLGTGGVSFREETKVARSGIRAFGFERLEYWQLPEWWFDERRGGGLSGGYRPAFIATSSGWPAIALRCDEYFSQSAWDALTAPNARPSSRTHRDYYPLSGGFDVIEYVPEPGLDPWPKERPIPVAPIWPGFVIDTVFYAAIWFGVFFGFTSAKRFLRIKRGRCPKCGYDLRGHRHQGIEASRDQGVKAGCPECGWNREGSLSS